MNLEEVLQSITRANKTVSKLSDDFYEKVHSIFNNSMTTAVNNGVHKLLLKPYAYTLCCALTVPAVELLGALGTFPNRFNTNDQITVDLSLIGFGAVMDGWRYLLRKHTVRESQTSENMLLQVMDKEYFEGVADLVRKRYKCSGNYSVAIGLASLDGTQVFRSGYFAKVTLRFDDEKEVPLLFKYTDRPDHELAQCVTDLLRKKRIPIAPRMFSPQGNWHVGSLGVNRGSFYEWIEGTNLESKKSLGTSPQVDHKFKPECMECILSHPGEPYPHPGKDHSIDTEYYLETVPYTLFSFNSMTDLTRFFDVGTAQKIIHLKEFEFHARLTKTLDSPFATEWDNTYKKLFENVPTVPIHGDLHQGNILLRNNGTWETPVYADEGDVWIIDWDNVQRGIPYHDFMHFSVLSDLDRRERFEAIKMEFIEDQKKNYRKWFGKQTEVNQVQLIATEFDVYLSLLNRYATAIQDGVLEDETKPFMKNSCRYLLEKAQESITLIATSTNNQVILSQFEDLVATRFAEVVETPFDKNASVAYAHHANQTKRRVDKAQSSVRNHSSHKNRFEKDLTLASSLENTRNVITLLAGYSLVLGCGTDWYEQYLLGKVPSVEEVKNTVGALSLIGLAYTLVVYPDVHSKLYNRLGYWIGKQVGKACGKISNVMGWKT